MHLENINELKKELSDQFIFNKKKISKSFANRVGSEPNHAELLKEMYEKVNGFSISIYEGKGTKLNVYCCGDVSAERMSKYIGVPLKYLNVSNIGIIQMQPVERRRPAWLGCSVSHFNGFSGSIGCIITNDSKNHYILSNNHVLANINEAKRNDPILQPGTHDNGAKMRNKIGELHDFKPIDFDGKNNVDIAIARLLDYKDVNPVIPDFGSISGYSKPDFSMKVTKYGRTTKKRDGVITDMHADIKVLFDDKIASFEDQIVIKSAVPALPFSQPGDSGSVIVEVESKKAVGLLFSGANGGITFANDFSEVYSEVNKYLPNFTIVKQWKT